MPAAILTRPLLDRAPAWVLNPGALPVLDFDFVNHRYWQQGRSDNIEALLTALRASTGYVDYVNGIWRPVTASTLRISDKGLLGEPAATNDALYARDLTQAAWVKTSVTAALDQVGIDGLANSASSLTATAGNGTVLQTITLGSQADTYSVFVKRITGTGEIDITENNGTTWTALSPAPSSSVWTRYQVTATLANPVFGLRVVTSGDKIAVDFNQLEPGGFATSPILTTNAAVTRAADVCTLATFSLGTPYCSVFTKVNPYRPITAAVSTIVLLRNGSDNNNRFFINRNQTTGTAAFILNAAGSTTWNVTSGGAIGQNSISRVAASLAPGAQIGYLNGTALTAGTGAFPNLPLTDIEPVVSPPDWQYVQRFTVWGTALSAVQLALLTGSQGP